MGEDKRLEEKKRIKTWVKNQPKYDLYEDAKKLELIQKGVQRHAAHWSLPSPPTDTFVTTMNQLQVGWKELQRTSSGIEWASTQAHQTAMRHAEDLRDLYDGAHEVLCLTRMSGVSSYDLSNSIHDLFSPNPFPTLSDLNNFKSDHAIELSRLEGIQRDILRRRSETPLWRQYLSTAYNWITTPRNLAKVAVVAVGVGAIACYALSGDDVSDPTVSSPPEMQTDLQSQGSEHDTVPGHGAWSSLPSLQTAADWFELNLLEPTVSVLTHPAISGALGRGFRFGDRVARNTMYDGCDPYDGCDTYYAPPPPVWRTSPSVWRTAPIGGW